MPLSFVFPLESPGQTGYSLAKYLAGLELYHNPGRNHKIAPLFRGIASHSRLREADLEAPESAQLDGVALRQARDDLVECSLYHIKDLVLDHSRFVADAHNQIALR